MTEDEYKIAEKYLIKYPDYKNQIEHILNTMDFDIIALIMQQLGWCIKIGNDFRIPSSEDLISIASNILMEVIYGRETSNKKCKVYIASLIAKCNKNRKLSLYFCPQFCDSSMESLTNYESHNIE